MKPSLTKRKLDSIWRQSRRTMREIERQEIHLARLRRRLEAEQKRIAALQARIDG